MEIRFIVNNIHPLKFLYLLEGTLQHNFEKNRDNHFLEAYQNVIVASQHNNGHVLRFRAKVKTVINSQEVNREKFQAVWDHELKSLGPEFEALFRDVKAENSFYHKGFYSLEIADLFRKMMDFTKDGLANRLFLEGVAYHMLAQQIMQYQDDLKNNGNGNLLRSYEVEKIKEAADIIKQEIADLETIAHLAKRVGLNVNKLQDGFHNLYHLTVHGYIKQTRLELAKTLLMNTDLSMGEIADKIGITSKSYFSKIFKEKYRITPSSFHHKQMEDPEDNNREIK